MSGFARKQARQAAKAAGKKPSSIREEGQLHKNIKELAKQLTPSIDEVFFDPDQQRYGIDYKRDVSDKDILGEFSRSTLSDMIKHVNAFTHAQSEFEVHYRNSNGSIRCEDLIETAGGYKVVQDYMKALWTTGIQLINHLSHVMNKIRKEGFVESEERFIAVFTKELNPEDPSGVLFGQYNKEAATLLDITKNLREIQKRFVAGLPYYVLLKKLPMSNNDELRKACEAYSKEVSNSIGSGLPSDHTQDESTDSVLAAKTDIFMDQIEPKICRSNLNAMRYFKFNDTEENILRKIKYGELSVFKEETRSTIARMNECLINEDGTLSYEKLKEEAKHTGSSMVVFPGNVERSVDTILIYINNLIAISHFSILKGYDQVLEEIKNGFENMLASVDKEAAKAFTEEYRKDNEVLLANLASYAGLVPSVLHFAHIKELHYNNEAAVKKLNQKFLKTK